MIDFIEPTIFFAVDFSGYLNFCTRLDIPKPSRHPYFIFGFGFHCFTPFLCIVNALNMPKLLNEKL
jgi:hypothetical protein